MIAKKNKRQKKGFTLIELLVVIVIIGILAALLLPAITSALGEGKGADCLAHLKSLYQASVIYLTQQRSLPTHLNGYDVWHYFGRTATNQLQITGGADAVGTEPIYQCPVAGTHGDKGDYRGPKSNWNIPPPSSFNYLGCDRLLSEGGGSGSTSLHADGGGNALRKDGGVIGVKASDITSTTAGTPGGDTEY